MSIFFFIKDTCIIQWLRYFYSIEKHKTARLVRSWVYWPYAKITSLGLWSSCISSPVIRTRALTKIYQVTFNSQDNSDISERWSFQLTHVKTSKIFFQIPRKCILSSRQEYSALNRLLREMQAQTQCSRNSYNPQTYNLKSYQSCELLVGIHVMNITSQVNQMCWSWIPTIHRHITWRATNPVSSS